MTDTPEQQYQKRVKELTPNDPLWPSVLHAFWVGGLICLLGEFLHDAAVAWLGLDTKDGYAFASIALVFLSALLTGLGVYDRIGKYAGAGSIVPITGFSNSIVAPAMEFKREGYVLGVASRMFLFAGPVLVYGIGASIIVGAIYLLFNL